MFTKRSVHIVRRLVWAGLLVAHAYWFAKSLVWPVTSTSSPLLLGLALGFFLLKVGDVRWLRVPCNRRAILCFVLVVVLLHSQVLMHILPDDAWTAWFALPAQVVTAIVLRFAVVALVCVLLHLAAGDERHRASITRLYGLLASAASSLRERDRTIAATPPRGPPARLL